MRRSYREGLVWLVVVLGAAGPTGCGDSNASPGSASAAGGCSGTACGTGGVSATGGIAPTSAGSSGEASGSSALDGGAGGATDEPGIAAGAAGAPSPLEACDEEGAQRCAGAAQTGRFECLDGLWQPRECERGELCDNETGECAAVIVDCAPLEPGDAYCEGSTRVVCGPDLVSIERQDCEHRCASGECVSFECGDGTVQSPEQCDDANDIETDACLSSCKLARCGDGIVHDGVEDCDDENRVESDDCTTACKAAECGDGEVWKDHEACDDGNDDDDDGCPSNCQEPRCGDGYLVRGVEACDDSNELSGDGCSGDCRAVEVSSLSLGDDHSCAVLHDGRLKCWGSNEHGQLGYGARGAVIGDSPGELGAALPTVLQGPVTEVAAGARFTCAIVAEAVFCFGDNAHGQLGRGSSSAVLVAPDRAELGGAAVSISAGANHACALLDSGAVKCWGANEMGQLGVSGPMNIGVEPAEMGDALPAVDLPGKAITVACGAAFSCAVLEDNRIFCWGSNEKSQLGPVAAAYLAEPVEIDTGDWAKPAPTRVALGGNHACAFTVEGRPACWGDATYGQLGSGSTVTPTDLEILSSTALGNGNILDIVAGPTTTCSLRSNGEVRCFGENLLGVLAKAGQYADEADDPGHLGDDETFVKPLRFPSDETEPKVRAIDLGAYHGCALLDTGKLACWGDNRKGQLGIGTTEAPSEIISDGIGELPTVALVE